ncbi:MAG TPA: nucleoside triphosphate pyrophosphatase [Geminicoccaceae bacterium]
MKDDVPLVLASSSPRRLALLRQVGVEPLRILPPEVDEAPLKRELPRQHALRVAVDKLNAALGALGDDAAFVIAADTVVACGRRILPKAVDRATAERCLQLLSGRRHTVIGVVAVADPARRIRTRLVSTRVRFKRLERSEIDRYLDSDEWRGKAGGYAIQGRAEAFVLQINGSYSNVVGLPLAETVNLLRGLGWTGS